jgi:hypothetical protein
MPEGSSAVKRTRRVLLVVVLGALGIPLLGICGFAGLLMGKSFLQSIRLQSYYGDYEARSSPLDPKVVAELCSKLELRDRDWRCKSGAVVYAPDFFGDIERFCLKADTYDDVEVVFGPYKYRCTQLFGDPADAGSYYVCDYDLRGDGVYLFSCTFGADGRL